MGTPDWTRRRFLRTAGAAALAGASLAHGHTVATGIPSKRPICAFTKFLQSLDYEELARRVAGMGFDGIEATVRRGGHVLPARVEEDLPRLVEALKRHGLRVLIMATDVNRADDPLTEKVLRTAASLGITHYRMAYYRYDLRRDIPTQLEALRPLVRDLAVMNRQLGIAALYQNHAGPRYVGATLWDIHRLIRDVPPDEMGLAFDIRHATVEGGRAWPLYWQLMRPHVRAVYVKDFRWSAEGVKNVPLGQGRVAPAFFQRLDRDHFRGPISLHVEYLEHAGVEDNTEALRRDLAVLRRLLENKPSI
jgi:sugar phosphate isomerase/epimerase